MSRETGNFNALASTRTDWPKNYANTTRNSFLSTEKESATVQQEISEFELKFEKGKRA